MPIPLIPLLVVAGGGALLLAGDKKPYYEPGKDPSKFTAPTPVSATPTTQSTGGEAGGAQAPSHADIENTTKDTKPGPGGFYTPGGGFMVGPPVPDPGPGAGGSQINGGGAASIDPWQPSSGPSIPSTMTPVDITTATGNVAEAGAKAAGQAFSAWGDVFGAVW